MSKSALDRKFDKILALEEAGLLGNQKGNRALRKLFANRLAMLGLLVFLLILGSAVFAPFLTDHDPAKINLRAML